MNTFNPLVSRVLVRAEYEVPKMPLGHIEFSISGDGAVAGLDRKSKYHDAPFVTPPMQSQIADHAFWRPIAIREASNRLAADFIRQVIPQENDVINGYLTTEFERIPFSFGLVFFPSGETAKGGGDFQGLCFVGPILCPPGTEPSFPPQCGRLEKQERAWSRKGNFGCANSVFRKVPQRNC